MSRTRRKKKAKHYKYYNLNIQAHQTHQPKVLKDPPVSNKLSYEITKDKSPIVRYNAVGDIVYSMQYIGDEKFEYWLEYDNENRIIGYLNSRGEEWRCKYNSKGNISDFWDNTGYFEKYSYYKNGLIIREDSSGEKVKKHIVRTIPITREVFINS
jgi:YD repeat-containing protein